MRKEKREREGQSKDLTKNATRSLVYVRNSPHLDKIRCTDVGHLSVSKHTVRYAAPATVLVLQVNFELP